MPTDPPLVPALVDSLKGSDASGALVEVAEVGLDAALKEGVLRDIPVLGSLVGLAKAAGTVRDHLFAKKVARFLVALYDVPAQERAAFLNDHVSPEDQRRLGDTILLLLDRADDFAKPPLLARLFAGYLKGEYGYGEFRSLATALDRLQLDMLHLLKMFYRDPPGDVQPGDELLSHLVPTGLVAVQFNGLRLGGTGGAFTRTRLGERFLRALGDAV